MAKPTCTCICTCGASTTSSVPATTSSSSSSSSKSDPIWHESSILKLYEYAGQIKNAQTKDRVVHLLDELKPLILGKRFARLDLEKRGRMKEYVTEIDTYIAKIIIAKRKAEGENGGPQKSLATIVAKNYDRMQSSFSVMASYLRESINGMEQLNKFISAMSHFKYELERIERDERQYGDLDIKAIENIPQMLSMIDLLAQIIYGFLNESLRIADTFLPIWASQ
jgi:hypothetical protein